MKNKKLFAILTLVCFMFTLMPVAAFAAEGAVLVNAKDSYKATAGEELTLSTTGASYGYTVYYAVDEDGEGAAVTDTNKMTLKNVGDYKVYAIGMATDAAYKGDVATIVNGVDTPAKKVATLVAWADGLDLILDDYAKVKVGAGEYEYKLQVVSADTTIATNNGFTDGDGDIVVQLLKSKDSWTTSTPVKNAELEIETIGYVDVVLEDGNKTNSAGKVAFTAVSGTTGTWAVVVSYADAEDLEIEVTATNGRVADVSVYNAAVAPKNIKSPIANTNVDFKFVDASGVAVDYAGDINAVSNITVVSQPADSNMDGDDFTLVEAIDPVTSLKVGEGVYRLTGNGTTYFEEEGTYEIKVSLENGKSATAKVTLAKQGDVVGIMFASAPKTVAYDVTGEETNVANGTNLVGVYGVMSVDAKGVTARVNPEFGYTGKAVTAFNTTTGKALLDADEDFIGSTITVYAVYKDFTASTTIDVIDGAAGIEYVASDLEVATNNTVYANIVDGDGKVVKGATLAGGANPIKVIVLDKPANAVVSAKANQALTAAGQVELNLLASTAGEYKIQTIVTLAGGKMISGTETFVVGAKTGTFNDVVVVSMGADKMIVNNEVVALDVAPFITAGRTMLQFNVLGAFGIDVQWDEATRSVIAEGNGTKVVLTIDSKVAVVNGQEVTLDVAPTIVNGRTVVPVGFITGNFGIAPTFTYNADGTIADILFTK